MYKQAINSGKPNSVNNSHYSDLSPLHPSLRSVNPGLPTSKPGQKPVYRYQCIEKNDTMMRQIFERLVVTIPEEPR